MVLAGPGGDLARQEAKRAGVSTILEAFPDRAYTANGHLAARSQPGAVLHDPDEIARRAVEMVVEGTVTTINAERVPLTVQTLCLHGDNPGATEAARAVRAALDHAGVEIRSL